MSGCHGNKTRTITKDDFPHTAKLTAEEITFDNNAYDEFAIVDSLLLGLNWSSDDIYVEAYRLPSLEHLGIVARHGRGPSEFLFAEYRDNNYYYDDEELNILMFDQFRNLACIVNLSQTIEQQKTVIEKEIKLSTAISVPYLVNKNTLLFRESNSEQTSTWYLYDVAKKQIQRYRPSLGYHRLDTTVCI
jgi:hypothetical protein